MVPVLRYKPLKQAADLFATSAKSAQTDFLNYMTRYEQALIELWQTQSLVKKAQAASGIASEHVAIAQVGLPTPTIEVVGEVHFAHLNQSVLR